MNYKLLTILSTVWFFKFFKISRMKKITSTNLAFLLQIFSITELKIQILSFCDFKDLGNLEKVCKKLNEFMKDDKIWKEFIQKRYPYAILDENVNSWKKLYLSRTHLPSSNLKFNPFPYETSMPKDVKDKLFEKSRNKNTDLSNSLPILRCALVGDSGQSFQIFKISLTLKKI